jgi:hypothetical protein
MKTTSSNTLFDASATAYGLNNAYCLAQAANITD